METTAEEKQNLAELNHDRLKVGQTNQGNELGPAMVINIAEMIIILGAAVTVDAIDVLDLTGFGAVLVRFIDIPTLGALWLWRILKHQAGPKKDPTFAILMAFLVELSPAGMVPTWTIFVAYVYFQDNKLAKVSVGGAMRTRQITKAIRRKLKK